MVDQSELQYRLLVRRYNVHVAYTPMFHSRLVAEEVTDIAKKRPRGALLSATRPAAA